MVEITNEIERVTSHLKNGELVAIPTETVYGLAASAFDELAVKKIYEAKGRPIQNPLIVHVHSIEQAKTIVEEWPEVAEKLAELFWPGPLTFILPKKNTIPDIVSAGLKTVGVRIPDHHLTLALLKDVDLPLAAPSANKSGYISPTSANMVSTQFMHNELSCVLDGGFCSKGIESTIIGFDNEDIIVYRLGSISIKELVEKTGLNVKLNTNYKEHISPGMSPFHYSPLTKLTVLSSLKLFKKNRIPKESAILAFKEIPRDLTHAEHRILSPEGCLKTAAKNLYRYLHELDQLGKKQIIAEKLPDFELGVVLNERLHKAAARPS